MNLFTGKLREQREGLMSIQIHILYKEGGEWQPLQVSGNTLQEIRQTGTWNNQKLPALKYPDGRVWYFSLRAWKK